MMEYRGVKVIEYGKVAKPHGLNGEVKLVPFSGDSENIEKIGRVFLKSEGGDGNRLEELHIVARRRHGNAAIVKFEGVRTKEQAERLRGCSLFVYEDELPETGEDEYYWFQLIGLRVCDEDGRFLGEVKNVLGGASQSLLVVADEGKEFYVPMVDAFIVEINLKESKVVVSPIEGLIP